MTERRRALVTGAAARLGRAMALDLAATGWDVAVHYSTSADAAAATVADAQRLGAHAIALHADLLRDEDVATLVDRAATGLGGAVALLINNASIFEHDEIGTITQNSWQRGVGSNLWAPVRLMQDFARQAPKARLDANREPVAQSVVINMLDQRVLKPTPMFASYSIAKAGLMSFTRSAAQALAPDIRVGAIGPGPTLRGSRQTEDHFATQRAGCILGRGSDPEDIVCAMQFIVRNKAFTGQMLAIDGGQHLAWQTPDVTGAVE